MIAARLTILGLVMLATAGAAPTPAATMMPAAVPSVPTPSATTSAPLGTPPAHSPAPATTPNYTYRIVPKPDPSADPLGPEIVEVDLNNRKVTDTIAIRVITNDAVVKVTSGAMGRSGVVPQTGPREFTAVSKIQRVPFFARGWGITLEIVAYTADGRKTSVKVPVTLG